MTTNEVPKAARNPRRIVGNTPLHSVRVSDDIWTAASKRARKQGTTPAAVMRKALEAYAKVTK